MSRRPAGAGAAVALLSFALAFAFRAPGAHARDLASVSWKDFAAGAELVVAARLVMAAEHMERAEIEYTFEVDRVFRGPKVDRVTFRREYRMTITTKVGTQAFLALKRAKGGGWELSVDERSCWPRELLSKPDFYSLDVVDVPDTLVRDIPKTLKKDVKLKAKLPGAGYHEYTASVYLAADVEKYLAERFK